MSPPDEDGPAESGDGSPLRSGVRVGDAGDESGSSTPDRPPNGNGEDGEDREEFGWREFGSDVASSVVAVFLVGFLLFAISGIWPPLVAVESGSMTPHMKAGDLVFVMEEKRFPGGSAHAGTGVVTARAAGDYRKFGQPGDVIVYTPGGNGGRTPIIHRAMFWIGEGENWYGKADDEHVGGADSCSELSHCPAPHAGFVTLGDSNEMYDQARSSLPPVKPAWVVGTAEVRVPALGWVRLRSGRGAPLDANGSAIGATGGNVTASDHPRIAVPVYR